MAGLVVTVNAVDITSYVDVSSIVVSEVGTATVATCTFDARDHTGTITISAKHAMSVVDDGTTLFSGRVADVEEGQEGIAKTWHVSCQDNNIYLDECVVESESYAAGTADDAMIADLISTYLSGLTTANAAQIDASMEAKVFEAMTMREILDEICGDTGGRYYVDYDKDLHYFDGDEGSAAAFSLSTSPDDAASFGFSDWHANKRSTQMCNKVLVIGHGVSGWVEDAASIATYGEIHGVLRDDHITTAQGVTDRGTEYVARYKDPETTYTCTITKDGLRAGQNLTVVNATWSINAAYTVRRLTMRVFGKDGEKRWYELELDDEAPDITDILKKLAQRIGSAENALEEDWYWDRDSANTLLYPSHSADGAPDHVSATWGGDIRTYSDDRSALTFEVDGATGNVGSGRSPTEQLDTYRATGAVDAVIESGDSSLVRVLTKNSDKSWSIGTRAGGNWRVRDETGGTNPLYVVAAALNNAVYIATTEVVINEDSGDLDFRWESDANVNGLFCEGSSGHVGIGRVPTAWLDVYQNNDENVTIKTTNSVNSWSIGAAVTSGAWRLRDETAGTNVIFCETGSLAWCIYTKAAEVVINENTLDIDFRVESDGNANMIMADAGLNYVGIGQAPAAGAQVLQVNGDVNVSVGGGGYRIGNTATNRHFLIGNGSKGVFRAVDVGADLAHTHDLTFTSTNSGNTDPTVTGHTDGWTATGATHYDLAIADSGGTARYVRIADNNAGLNARWEYMYVPTREHYHNFDAGGSDYGATSCTVSLAHTHTYDKTDTPTGAVS